MKIQSTKRVAENRSLFVWNGSSDGFAVADQLIANSGPTAVYVVHAMPHGSIYQYGGIRSSGAPINQVEMKLRQSYREMAEQFTSFRDVNLTLLFGDRVQEIARFANQFKIASILMPSFEQSSFSRWLHGDLNTQLASKFFGSVTILDNNPVNLSPHLKSHANN